jgi:hypothetical protein
LLNCPGNVKAPIKSKIVGISSAEFLRAPLPCRARQEAGSECEAIHMRIAARAVLLCAAGGGLSRFAAMTTRRLMCWWFRFVLSGRFLDRFLSLPREPH